MTAQLDGVSGSIKEQTRAKHLSAGRLSAFETELERLHAELERVVANDFFEAKGRAQAANAYERCKNLLGASQTPNIKSAVASTKRNVLSVQNYQGRRWVTRRNIHIDRLASAWLIKQFIDKHPRFYFVSEGEEVKNAIAFDMFAAEFTHQGEDCTFETTVRRFGLSHIKGLRELGEIVHDIDLKDDKFHRLEAAGLRAIIDGLCVNISDDRKRLLQATVIFDGLFALMDKAPERKQLKSRRKSSPKK